MQLTPLQLQIQQRSDKTLSFGCMIEFNKKFAFIIPDFFQEDCFKTVTVTDLLLTKEEIELSGLIKVIGHPMNRGRLCYLMETNKCKADDMIDLYSAFRIKYKECLQQTVLERPTEVQELVLKFLLTLPKS